MSTLITLEDIKNSRYLWENGVMPGDKFEDGEIIRVHSDEGATRETGKRITEADIANSPYLQQNNIKPNDIFTEDNEIIRTGSDSAAKQFMYGFDEAGNPIITAEKENTDQEILFNINKDSIYLDTFIIRCIYCTSSNLY